VTRPGRAVGRHGHHLDGGVQTEERDDPLAVEGPHRSIGGPREDPCAVRRQRDGGDALAMGGPDEDALERAQPPVAHGAVLPGGDDARLRLVDGHGRDAALMAPQRAQAPPSSRAQSRTVPSRLAETRFVSPAATAVTASSCPAISRTRRPLTGSHRRTTPVRAPGEDEAPARHDRKARREAGVARPGARGPAGRKVPQAERRVLEGRDEEAPSGRRASARTGPSGIGIVRSSWPVPASQTRTSAPLPGADGAAVGRESQGGHGAGQAAQRPQGRRQPRSRSRHVLVEVVPAAEGPRHAERDERVGPASRGRGGPDPSAGGRGEAGVRRGGLLHPADELRVRQSTAGPRGESGV